MMPSYDPNAKLAGKIRARHIAAIKRERAGLSRALWNYFITVGKLGAGAAAAAVDSALRALQRRRERHYGLGNAYHPHAGRQEILRAQLGGFHHGAEHVNRVMVRELGHSRFPQFIGPARPTKREILHRLECTV